jgi:hypothetical protein
VEQALRTTAYVPTSRAAIDRVLSELLDRLFDSLMAENFSPEPGRMVGQRLVAAYFLNEQSLSRTIEVLGQGLPANPELQGVDGLAGKVVSVLGAVAAGYAAALRDQIFDQQEEIKKALLRARRTLSESYGSARRSSGSFSHPRLSGSRSATWRARSCRSTRHYARSSVTWQLGTPCMSCSIPMMSPR